MVTNQETQVQAVISPRSTGGQSLFDATEINSVNVSQFRSEEGLVQQTVNRLRQANFIVHQISDITISFSGPLELFRTYFNAELRATEREVTESLTIPFFEAEAPTARERQLLTTTSDTELANLIEGVALAEPPELFEAAVPPRLDPNPYYYLCVPDDVGLMLNANRVHRFGVTGSNIKVAMVDSGFYRHPFYNLHGYRVSSVTLGPGATSPEKDMNGHGTGEAANIFSAAPDIRLLPVKGLSDPVGSFNAAVARTPHIITNSWGYSVDRPPNSLSPYLATLAAAIANAVANGITVCFSAGNGHYGFPGSMPDVISVGGVHVNYPALSLEASNYASSFDSHFYPGRHVPDLCGLVGRNAGGAPLIMLPVQPGASLDTGTNDGWGRFSGTSAASPQIAGVCALVLERNPSLTPAKVKDVLIASCTDVTTGQSAMGQNAGPGADDATGAGLVNAKWAYLRAFSATASAFFAASTDEQQRMIQSGQMPPISEEVLDDLMEVLRSR
ncbi:MAG: S8 family serine peptidase [Dehalococcoidia bacterium]